MIIVGITKKSIGLFLDYKNNVELAYLFPLQKKNVWLFLGFKKKRRISFYITKKSVGLFFDLQKKPRIIFGLKKSVELCSGLKQKHRDYNPLLSMDWVYLQYCLLE